MEFGRQTIQMLVGRFGYQIRRLHPEKRRARVDVLGLTVEHVARSQPDPVVVQIGANDGRTADPIGHLIRQHGWRALLVEPAPSVFPSLTEVYRESPRAILENAALADRDGTMTFYGVDDPEGRMPFWCQQISALDRDRVLALLREHAASLPPGTDPETLVKADEVPALRFETLFARHGIERVDALVVDTLGFDAKVLAMFPFDTIGEPAVISFETTFLRHSEREACLDSLSARGYGFCHSGMDTIACRERIFDD